MRLMELPSPARFLTAALRAVDTDRRAMTAWEDGEMLALSDAVGLRRDAAVRLAACLLLLLREARHPLRLRPVGCCCASPDEIALVGAFGAMQVGRPWEAQRLLAAWLPARRRVQGIALLAIAARDLAAFGYTVTGVCAGPGRGTA